MKYKILKIIAFLNMLIGNISFIVGSYFVYTFPGHKILFIIYLVTFTINFLGFIFKDTRKYFSYLLGIFFLIMLFSILFSLFESINQPTFNTGPNVVTEHPDIFKNAHTYIN